jgi:hypothetical protein
VSSSNASFNRDSAAMPMSAVISSYYITYEEGVHRGFEVATPNGLGVYELCRFDTRE